MGVVGETTRISLTRAVVPFIGFTSRIQDQPNKEDRGSAPDVARVPLEYLGRALSACIPQSNKLVATSSNEHSPVVVAASDPILVPINANLVWGSGFRMRSRLSVILVQGQGNTLEGLAV